MRILLFAFMLVPSAAWACMCESIWSWSTSQAVVMARQQVRAADEILRVRVAKVAFVGPNTTTFVVQVREALKSNSTQAERTLSTGPDSCNLGMRQDEEWLVFVTKGRVSQCSESWPLDTREEGTFGSNAKDAAEAREQVRTMAAHWLSIVRFAVSEGGSR